MTQAHARFSDYLSSHNEGDYWYGAAEFQTMVNCARAENLDGMIDANAAAGIVEGLSGRGWDIRRRDIQVGVDFESTECRADAEVTVTISLGRILAVLLAAGFGFIKIKRAAGKAAAAEKAERKDNDGTDADPNGGIPAGQHG